MTAEARAQARRRPALAVAVLAVLALTLFPDSGQRRLRCIVCGELALADALRNIVLFLPVGAALAANGWTRRRAFGGALALSLGVELAQLVVPGRTSSVSDLLTNAGGAVLGHWLFIAAPRWLAPSPRLARGLAAAAAASALAFAALTLVLLRPSIADRMLFAQWMPVQGHLEAWRGRIDDVTLGGLRLPDGRLNATGGLAPNRAVRLALLRGDTLTVLAHAGPRTTGLAPIFSMADAYGREILLIGADRGDLVLRYRMRAATLRLDQPDLRLRGVLDALPAGVPMNIVVTGLGPRPCIALNGQRACPSVGVPDGWAFFTGASRMSGPLHAAAGALWLALLALPAGYWALRMRAR